MTDPDLDLQVIDYQGRIASASDIGVDDTRTSRTKQTYNVIQFFGDTRIEEAIGDMGEYSTFADAKEVAIDYLQDVISLCEDTLEEIRGANSPQS